MKHPPGPSSADGATLVIMMVFLLILSLIAIGGHETAMLETAMVANSARTHRVQENAEHGLMLGELAIRRITADGVPLDLASRDLVYPLEGPGSIDPLGPDWTAIPVRAEVPDLGVEYVIQYAGAIEVRAAGASVVTGRENSGETARAHLFVVTARAELSGTVRLLQSVFLAASPP
ncbi:MAG: hypothetical protein P8Z78_01085 [Gammaproteobacteria bacterium]|jgi:hypothetical protein